MVQQFILSRQFRYHPIFEEHIFEPNETTRLFLELDDPKTSLYQSIINWIGTKRSDRTINIQFGGNYETNIRTSDTIFDLMDRLMEHCSRFKEKENLRTALFKTISGNESSSKAKLKSCDLHIESIPYELCCVEINSTHRTFNIFVASFSKMENRNGLTPFLWGSRSLSFIEKSSHFRIHVKMAKYGGSY